jgi:hypothetical protein
MSAGTRDAGRDVVFAAFRKRYRRCNMAIATFEGVVKDGQIRLRGNVTLPEDSEVYVVIPDFETVRRTHVPSPHLVHPEQAADFAKQVIQVADDANL